MSASAIPERTPAWSGPPDAGVPRFRHAPPAEIADWLEGALRAFAPGPIRVVGTLAQGGADLRLGHYLAETPAGPLVCHVKKPSGGDDLEIACRLAEWLAARGVPALPLARAGDGRPEARLDGLAVTAAPYRPLRHSRDDPADAAALGATLAAVHGALASCPFAEAVARRTAAVARQIEATRAELRRGASAFAPADFADLLQIAVRDYDPDFGGGPAQCLHGDVTPGNVMFDESGTAWLLDFEDAAFCFRPRAFDIASALLRFCLAPPGSGETRHAALRTGYLGTGGDWPEEGALSAAVRGCVLHNLLTLAALSREGATASASEWRKFAALAGPAGIVA